jgi:maltose/moltooligosaccharide transporter
MSFTKPRLSFWQIINMNVGFFGIQYSFGLQQSAVNPIYDFLGASPDEIPWLNLAGPLTGLLVQPIIGALSDRTWHPKFGRRKPYFFIGAIMCSLALFAFPFSSSLWMAAGLLWILDAGNNTAMEPYRAFVADKLPSEQQGTGFLSQSFFTGFGQTLANLSLFIFPLVIIGKTGALPNWVFASFFLGAVCSIGSIWWSMKTTPEIPPSDEELIEIKKYNEGKPNPVFQILAVLVTICSFPLLFWYFAKSLVPSAATLLLLPVSFLWVFFLYKIIKAFPYNKFIQFLKTLLSPFIEVIEAIGSMPKIMWMLALVYLFQWYALFCYWQNSSKAIANNTYGWKVLNKEQAKTKATFLKFTEEIKANAKSTGFDFDSIKKLDNTYNLLYNNWKDKITVKNKLTETEIQSLGYLEANDKKYEEAVSWTGLVNGWYNIVTFLIAFGLVWLAKKYSPKIVHMLCLILAGVGFIAFSFVENKYLYFPAITGFGIGWASMMGIPYMMVVKDIPKEKYGVYMGIINMMIVIPMFIQTITFGYIMKHFLGNDSNKAILFAGVFLLIAAFVTSFIKAKKLTEDEMVTPITGGH